MKKKEELLAAQDSFEELQAILELEEAELRQLYDRHANLFSVYNQLYYHLFYYCIEIFQ